MHKKTEYAQADNNLRQLSYRKIQGADFAVYSIYDVRLEEVDALEWCRLRDQVASTIVLLKAGNEDRLPSENQLQTGCERWLNQRVE